MMKKESVGERIRQRRKALKFTQQTLATGIGVSHVAVSQWEKDETVPRGENLLRLAELLQCSAAWIIDGEGQPFASAQPGPALTAVPLVTLAQAADWLDEQRLQWQQQASQFLYSDELLSDSALAVTLEDGAMLPDYRAGDRLLFDLQRAPQPGDVVLAQAEQVAVVRIFRLHDEQIFSLRPLNEDFPVQQSHKNALQLIGTLVEMRRRGSR